MSKPEASLRQGLNRKKNTPSKPGGVAATFRTGDDDQPMKKTTFRIPQELHRDLQLRAIYSGTSMGDLVMQYIEDGLNRDETPS